MALNLKVQETCEVHLRVVFMSPLVWGAATLSHCLVSLSPNLKGIPQRGKVLRTFHIKTIKCVTKSELGFIEKLVQEDEANETCLGHTLFVSGAQILRTHCCIFQPDDPCNNWADYWTAVCHCEVLRLLPDNWSGLSHKVSKRPHMVEHSWKITETFLTSKWTLAFKNLEESWLRDMRETTRLGKKRENMTFREVRFVFFWSRTLTVLIRQRQLIREASAWLKRIVTRGDLFLTTLPFSFFFSYIRKTCLYTSPIVLTG